MKFRNSIHPKIIITFFKSTKTPPNHRSKNRIIALQKSITLIPILENKRNSKKLIKLIQYYQIKTLKGNMIEQDLLQDFQGE